MHVDHRADVGAQAQDLAIEVVADAGHARAVEQAAGRDFGDDDVLDPHLLERDLRMLGVGDAVRMIGMRARIAMLPSVLWT